MKPAAALLAPALVAAAPAPGTVTLHGLGPLRIGTGAAELRSRFRAVARELIVETWDGRARSMRVGYWRKVQLIEGCSWR